MILRFGRHKLLTAPEWRDILEQYDGRCAYCGCNLDRPTIDHVVPLSRGGEHCRDNVVPACGHCNSSKGAKTLTEWRAKEAQYADRKERIAE
jgi:5-methylcytosine-specific restriction endonuclease McrA